MFKKTTAVLIIIFLMILSGCADKRRKYEAQGIAPDFTLQDLDNRTVSLSDFRGKVVVLDFWATWCPPCRASIPGLERLHRTYSKKGLVLLAVSLDEGGWEDVKSFRTEYGISYTILKGTEEVASKYIVRSIPMLVVIDREGKERKRLIGFGTEEELEKEIISLLDTAPPASKQPAQAPL